MAPIKKITKHTPYKASVGKRLEILRNQLGLDMQTMAARMSVTVWTYRAYRKGDRLPSTENLDQLTRTRNISLDWLFAGRGDMFYRDAKQALKEAREAERAQQAGDFFLSELEEMKHIMQRVPIVRHLVMANYQQVKIEQKETIDRELEAHDTNAKEPRHTEAVVQKAPPATENKEPRHAEEVVHKETHGTIKKEPRHAEEVVQEEPPGTINKVPQRAEEVVREEAPPPIKKVTPKIPKKKRKKR